MNDVTIFNFDGADFRVIIRDGEPWFVAKDVCDVLELSNPREAVSGLDDDEKNTVRISDGIRGNPNMNIISESGLYTLVMRSNKPEARRFRKWVTSEVLPTIRKHGAYATPQTIENIISDPGNAIRLLQALKEEQERSAALRKQAEIDAPKALFADAVSASDTCILVGELAKILRQNGVKIGQNRLFEQMRNDGWLMKSGDSRNMPTQKAMEMALFEIKERTIQNPDGSVRITKTTKITGKGQIYLTNYYINKLSHTDAADD